MSKSISFETHHREFLSDPKRAKAFLEVVIEDYAKDGNTEIFLAALRDVIEAQDDSSQLAEKSEINNEHMELDTLVQILQNLGFRLSIEPLKIEQAV